MQEELEKLKGHLKDIIGDLDLNEKDKEDFSMKGFLAQVEALEASYAKSKMHGKALEKSVESQKNELRQMTEKQKQQEKEKEKLPPLKEIGLSKIKEEEES
jgi:hypothetical protein